MKTRCNGLQRRGPQTCVEDVVRRLRKIGQPKTLFGETDEDRLRRLLKCEAEMVVDELDDHGVTGKNVLKARKGPPAGAPGHSCGLP